MRMRILQAPARLDGTMAIVREIVYTLLPKKVYLHSTKHPLLIEISGWNNEDHCKLIEAGFIVEIVDTT